ncbi:hypothetical protein [Algivirga pacifica]|uniref:Uncharacterized protein n=1 Tax=Algivirga pacifica TaxID=1162670 RepID=A0ABP9DDC1_9BACT
MDQLEKFIIKHQEALEVYTPSLMSRERFNSLLEDGLSAQTFVEKGKLNKQEPSQSSWRSIRTTLRDEQSWEDHIKEQQNALDVLQPSDKLWTKIEGELPAFEKTDAIQDTESTATKETGKTIAISIRQLWQYAAAVILVGFGLGYTFQFWMGTGQSPILPKEIVEAERHYTSLISMKQRYVQTLPCSDPRLLSDFEQEQQLLEDGFDELKQEAVEQQGAPMVLEAMIQNLQLRIALLNKQISILEQLKNNDKVEDDEEDISI